MTKILTIIIMYISMHIHIYLPVISTSRTVLVYNYDGVRVPLDGGASF